jgi:hypothetical protein
MDDQIKHRFTALSKVYENLLKDETPSIDSLLAVASMAWFLHNAIERHILERMQQEKNKEEITDLED